MIATIINVLTVLLGSFFGLFFRKHISEKINDTVYNGVGLFTLVIGMSMALAGKDVIHILLALIMGGLLGLYWNVEQRILNLGNWLKKKFVKKNHEDGHSFAEAFLDSSLLFCIGAMSIIGSFKAGIEHDYTIILTKSVMDGFVAVIMSAAMGIGVAFSALIVLIYQGALTLLSSLIKPWVSDMMLNNLTGLGGILILMIGFNMLSIKKIKTANFLPSLLLIIIIVLLDEQFRPSIISMISAMNS